MRPTNASLMANGSDIGKQDAVIKPTYRGEASATSLAGMTSQPQEQCSVLREYVRLGHILLAFHPSGPRGGVRSARDQSRKNGTATPDLAK